MKYSPVLAETTNTSAVFITIVFLVFISIVIFAAYKELSKKTEVITTNEISEAKLELNQVQKELLALGFPDFTLRSLVNFFELNQEFPFKLVAKYTEQLFTISLKLKSNRLLAFDFYSDEVIFVEIDKEPLKVKLYFSEEDLNNEIDTTGFRNTHELFTGFKWNKYVNGSKTVICATQEVYTKLIS